MFPPPQRGIGIWVAVIVLIRRQFHPAFTPTHQQFNVNTTCFANARAFALLFIFCLCSSVVVAQTTVSGRITDSFTGEGLIGAQVVATDTDATAATATDETGAFSLEIPAEVTVLSVRYVGYETQEVPVGSGPLRIRLESAGTALDQVVVSANRQRQLRSEVPAAITTLSARTIAESDANTLDQVLNKVPGVFVADLANEQHMTSIRQPISTKGLFLFLEDGLPTRPTGVFNHNALNEMNQGAIQSVEIIRGPASSTYGAEAIGGVINILTAAPTGEFSGRHSLRLNTNGMNRHDLRLSNTFGKTGVFFGGYYAKRRNGFFDHSDMDKFAGTLKVTHPISKRDFLTVAATYADLETDMTGALDSAAFFGGDVTSTQTFTERTVSALRVQSTWQREWTADGLTTARAFYRNNTIGQIPSYRVRLDRRTGVVSGTINARDFQSVGGILQHKQRFNFLNAEVIGGVSLDNSPTRFFEDYILIDRDENGINVGYTDQDSTLTRNEIDLFNVGAYGTLQLRPLERVKVSLSLRYDRFQYDHRNALSSEAFSGSPDAKSTFKAFTPKLGLIYDFGADRGLYANYAQGFLPPQVGELYRGVSVPVLEPAVYDNYEVGGWYGLRAGKHFQGRLDLAAYQIEATNQIISVLLDDETRENRNAGATRSRGIEYGVNLSYRSTLSFRWSGSFARHEFVDYVENGQELNGNELAQGPNSQFNWELTYRPNWLAGLRLSVENQRLGAYWMNAENTVQYDGFSLLNFRAGYRWRGFDFRFTMLNATDELWSPRASASRFGTRYTLGIPRTLQVGIGYDLAELAGNPRKK